MTSKGDMVGHLEEEAIKRRARLAAMREAAKENLSKQDHGSGKNMALPTPKFRNYEPQADNLKDSMLPKGEPDSVEERIKDQLEATKLDTLIDDIDLDSLAPRKVDWDLKRTIAAKIDKLERRTQIAIAEIIRERLAQTQNPDLVEATQVLNETQPDAQSDEE